MQKICSDIILFISLSLIGYKIYDVNKVEIKGVCSYTNSVLSRETLYKNAVYFYLRKVIGDIDDFYDMDCSARQKCGFYYLKKDQILIEEKVKKFNIDSSDFVNLLENKKDMYHVKISSLYMRGPLNTGNIDIFTGIYTQAEKGDTSNANYFLGIKRIEIDENNNMIYDSYSFEPYFIPVDNCGKLLIF